MSQTLYQAYDSLKKELKLIYSIMDKSNIIKSITDIRIASLIMIFGFMTSIILGLVYDRELFISFILPGGCLSSFVLTISHAITESKIKTMQQLVDKDHNYMYYYIVNKLKYKINENVLKLIVKHDNIQIYKDDLETIWVKKDNVYYPFSVSFDYFKMDSLVSDSKFWDNLLYCLKNNTSLFSEDLSLISKYSHKTQNRLIAMTTLVDNKQEIIEFIEEYKNHLNEIDATIALSLLFDNDFTLIKRWINNTKELVDQESNIERITQKTIENSEINNEYDDQLKVIVSEYNKSQLDNKLQHILG